MKTFIIALLCLVAFGCSAQTVYVTATGTSYHKSVKCMCLSRSTSVAIDSTTAASQLKPCGICYKQAAKADKATGVTLTGKTIYTGSKGGQYYIEDGKKKYIPKS